MLNIIAFLIIKKGQNSFLFWLIITNVGGRLSS